MSSATAVRTHSKGTFEGRYEGLDEMSSPIEQVAEADAPDWNWESAWKTAQDGLLADVKRTDLQVRFEELADELEEDTAVLSATRRAMKLPAFREILALGDEVIPEVIERLKTSDNRPVWLRMLGTLTPFPPGAGEETIDDAADVWIQWGRLSN
jgi:hypothetical protein